MSITAIILIVVGIGGLIFVHELGHFTVAKWAGVKVEVFSVGFGWKLLSYTYGDTEYCLSAIPLGGYVRMAGEMPEDDREGEDYELYAKPAWKRFWIFSAGSLMNLIIAFPICILMYWIGVDVPKNQVGALRPGTPEWEAGISPGDRIVGLKRQQGASDGKDADSISWGPKQEVNNLGDYQEALLSVNEGQKIKLYLKSRGDNGEATTRTVVVKAHSPNDQGISPYSNVIKGVPSNTPAADAGLKPGDRIQKIQGWTVRSVQDIRQSLDKFLNPDLTYLVRRADGSKECYTVPVSRGTPYLAMVEGQTYPLYDIVDEENIKSYLNLQQEDTIIRVNSRTIQTGSGGERKRPDEIFKQARFVRVPSGPVEVSVLRNGKKLRYKMQPEVETEPHVSTELLLKPIIKSVKKGSPADQAGLKKDDQVVEVAGIRVGSMFHMKKLLDAYAGEEIQITVRRDDREINKSVTPMRNERGDGQLGVIVDNRQEPGPLPELPKFSAFYKSDFRKGDVIKAFYRENGTKVELDSIYKFVRYFRQFTPSSIRMIVERTTEGNTETMEQTLEARTRDTGKLGVQMGMDTFNKQYGLVGGIVQGTRRTIGVFGLTFIGISRLFKGSEDASEGLAGPVRIASVSYQTARRDVGQFLLMLAMISISLGILNLLPLPPLDGGHILFLVLEKIRGAPLSEDVLYMIQLSGFLFLIFLIIVVTYWDIINLM